MLGSLSKGKPGLLRCNSAQDSRTWELGGEATGRCRELVAGGSFIYLADLQPCLLLVGAAGRARSQHVLRHPLLLAQGMLSTGCLQGRPRGSSLPHQGHGLAAVGTSLGCSLIAEQQQGHHLPCVQQPAEF